MSTTNVKRRTDAASPERNGEPDTSSDPRPLGGYAMVLGAYGLAAGGLAVALRKRVPSLRRLDAMDLLLYGLATEHLTRLITKDSVTAVLRAPFTKFKEPAGDGEVNEDAIGHGTRHAVGELLTCPFCSAQWVATALVAGRIAAPNLTRAVVSVSAAARLSDYLQLLNAFFRRQAE